jgi:hypothetical protein
MLTQNKFVIVRAAKIKDNSLYLHICLGKHFNFNLFSVLGICYYSRQHINTNNNLPKIFELF